MQASLLRRASLPSLPFDVDMYQPMFARLVRVAFLVTLRLLVPRLRRLVVVQERFMIQHIDLHALVSIVLRGSRMRKLRHKHRGRLTGEGAVIFRSCRRCLRPSAVLVAAPTCTIRCPGAHVLTRMAELGLQPTLRRRMLTVPAPRIITNNSQVARIRHRRQH